MSTESPLFLEECLVKAKFPRLDPRGLSACQLEIHTRGITQFLEDGWYIINRDNPVLAEWISKNITLNFDTSDSLGKTITSRSFRYGAALVYFPLQIQAENSPDQQRLPKISTFCGANMVRDLDAAETQDMDTFLTKFDPILARFLDTFIHDPINYMQNDLGLDLESVTLSAYMTYYILASRAESVGLAAQLGIEPSETSSVAI